MANEVEHTVQARPRDRADGPAKEPGYERGSHLPTMPDPSADRPEDGAHLPTMPDPSQKLPPGIDDPAPEDGEESSEPIEKRIA
jgi:hypothetical protein